MLQSNEKILEAGDMSFNLVSPAINVNQIYLYAIQLRWTGTPTGIFTVEASVDPGSDQLGANVTNWTTLSNSAVSTSGDSGNWLYRGLNVSEKWVRVRYSRSSGSGILDVRFNAKGV